MRQFLCGAMSHLTKHSMALDCRSEKAQWRNKGISVGLSVTNCPAVLKYAILMFRFVTALLYKLHHLMYWLVRQKYVTPHL